MTSTPEAAGRPDGGGQRLHIEPWPVATGAALNENQLDLPSRWRNPRHVIVPDLFGDGVPDEDIAQVWQRMAGSPRHTFQLATSDPARMRGWVNRCAVSPNGWITHDGTDPARACGGTGVIVGYPKPPERPSWWGTGRRGGKPRHKPQPPAYGWPLPNLWLGVRIRSQDDADHGAPALFDTPAAVRWALIDSPAAPIGLGMVIWAPPWQKGFPGTHNALTGEWWPAVGNADEEYHGRDTGLTRLDWVAAEDVAPPGGSLSGPAWARSLRDACQEAGVAFSFTRRRPGRRLDHLLDGHVHDQRPRPQRGGNTPA